MIFNWDQPLVNIWLWVYVFTPVLLPLIPGVVLAIMARRRGGDDSATRGETSGAMLARSLLKASGLSSCQVVSTSVPPSNVFDPWRDEIRLAPAVHDGRTDRAWCRSAHLVGRAIASSRSPWRSKGGTMTLLGLRLLIGSSRIVLVAGLLMLDPGLCFRASLLNLAGVVGMVALKTSEVGASRRVEALGEAFDPVSRQPATIRAFRAAAWSDLEEVSIWPWPIRVGVRSARSAD